MRLRDLPATLVPIAIYWALFVLVGGDMTAVMRGELFSVPNFAGARLEISIGDGLNAVTLLALAFSVVGSSRRYSSSFLSHALRLLLSIAAIAMLVVATPAATAVFALIALGAWLETVLSYTVGIRTARRDLSIGGEDGYSEPKKRRAWFRRREAVGSAPDARLEPGNRTSHPETAPAPFPVTPPSQPAPVPAPKPTATPMTVPSAAPASSAPPTPSPSAVESVAAPAVSPAIVEAAKAAVAGAVEPQSTEPATGDSVDCSVFAPSTVARGERFVVQVLLHTKPNLIEAAKMARVLDRRASRRGAATLDLPVSRGSTIDLMLDCADLDMDESLASLLWNGETGRCAFSVRVPEGVRSPEINGAVMASVDGVPVGEIWFKIFILAKELEDASARSVAVGLVGETTVERREPAWTRARQYTNAFISYSRADVEKVTLFAQGLEQTGMQLFVDVNGIEPGEEWAGKLASALRNSDVLFLMWSDNAARSAWVGIETKTAVELQKKSPERLPRILPITLHRGAPNPPDYLINLHFDSVWLAHREAQKIPMFAAT